MTTLLAILILAGGLVVVRAILRGQVESDRREDRAHDELLARADETISKSREYRKARGF